MRVRNKRILILAAIAGAAMLLPMIPASGATIVDLTAGGKKSDNIGDVIFSRDNYKPTGTGVFDPFLTIQSPGSHLTEEGYNTGAGSGNNLPLDDLRNHWNKDVRVGDLATTVIKGVSYYTFELDANEPGQGTDKKYLSIDNIRLYTSPTPGQTTSNPDKLGTLRYALNSLNDPLNVDGNYVKIDATRNDITGQVTSGSGSADLLVYIPTSYLAGAAASDYLYFYNLNGAHFASDSGTGAQAGFEEWRVLTAVPDAASTITLLGVALLTVDLLRRKFAKA